MTGIDHLVSGLVDAFARGPEGGSIEVTEVTFDVPVETTLDGRGVGVVLPGGRLATGFDRPLGRLRAHLVADGS